MGLASRDLWIILRARDVASATIRGVGTEVWGLARRTSHLTNEQRAARLAMMQSGAAIQQLGKFATTAGIGLTALGLAGAGAIKSFTSAAQEFERSAALAVTQVHNGQTSVQDLERISMDVARAIPVPIETLNQALYDIFSSTDIKVKDSSKVLRQFSIAAVAGQDSIINVGRTAISILNAWDEPLSNLNHIFDVQFKMVQLGVGTYAQFASVLGRAIPSVRATGQSFEFLAGTMAFLTRRGQSAANAAVSIARLSDMFRRPATFKGLHELGKLTLDAAKSINQDLDPATTKWLKGFKVELLDAHGNMKPINQLLKEMAPAFLKLRAPARAGLFKDVFGAQGTIQARRFFDLAIGHTAQLNQFIKDVGNSSGATGKAYREMASTFAAKSQLLKNNWEILKIQLGNALIPQLSKFIDQIIKLVKWFENLSPHTKDMIAKFMIWGSIIAIVAGVFLTLLGVIGMLVGGMIILAGALGMTLGGFLLIAGIIVAAIAVFVVLWFIIHKYQNQIHDFIIRIWNDIARFFIRIWNDIAGWAESVWKTVADFFVDRWHYIEDESKGIWNAITGFLSDRWNYIKDEATGIWNAIVNFFKDRWEFAKNTTISVWNAIFGFLKAVWKIIRIAFAVWLALVLLPWTVLWNMFGKQLKAAWHGFLLFLKIIWKVIADFFKDQWAIAVILWKNLWESFKIIGVAFWHAINIAFRFVWLQIKKFFIDQWAIAVVLWRNLWESFKIIGVGFWHAINIAFRFVWLQIKKFFIDQWNVAVTIWKNLWESFRILGKSGWGNITGIIKGAWHGIMTFFKNQITPFKVIWNNFVESLRIIWDRVKGIFAGPVNWVIAHVLNPFIRSLNSISKKFGVALNIPLINPIGVSTQSGKQGSGRRLATGGPVRGPGGPTADRITALLSNGEFVVNAAATARHYQLLEAINANRFAGGGLVGAITNPVGTAVNVALHRLPGGDALHRLISGAAHKFISALAGVLKSKIGSFLSIGGKGGSAGRGQLANWINAAMLITNTPLNWGAAILRRIMFESGGNPNAINLTDINAQRGDPSRGLMQTIMATFRAFHQAGTSNNIFDPVANIAAALNYIKSRYGTIFRIDPPVRGYAGGGLITEPIFGIGRSGRMYSFGESGPELVTPSRGRGRGEVTQNFYITTQEIDPRRHAQQLGWELANR